MNMFDMDDPAKNAEDKMSDGIVQGCIVIIAAFLLFGGIVATLVKVWMK